MILRQNTLRAFATVVIAVALTGGSDVPTPQTSNAPDVEAPRESNGRVKNPQWVALFDGKSLEGWKASDFPGKGKVTVENGSIVLGAGMDMTGITVDRKIPKVDYEIELEARRVAGSDFFCGLTFPAGDEYCSLIVGGWGGGVVGLSSLDGMDASENETSTYREFKNGEWYPVRLRVTGKRITAWIDGKQEVDVDVSDRGLDTRLEVEWSKPFGIATWNTTAHLRKLRIRELAPAEVQVVNADLPEP